jgi:hypothetical protein|tara:strand:+ start:415 stop:756 length:342 start_codon:yes stop_codon:yes gene_type:complete
METKDDNLYKLQQIVKNYGEPSAGKDVWQQLQASIINHGNNTPITRIFLLEDQTKMLKAVFHSSRYLTESKFNMIQRVIDDRYYKEEDKELLNEIRSDYVRETANNSEMYWGN